MIIKGAYTLSHQVTLKTAIISYDFSIRKVEKLGRHVQAA